MRKLILSSAAAAIGGLALTSAALAAAPAAAQPYPYDEPGYYPHYGYGYDRYYDEGWRAPRGEVPVDRFGPDPNGMVARDGHIIKCKLTDSFSYDLDRYVTRRVCD